MSYSHRFVSDWLSCLKLIELIELSPETLSVAGNLLFTTQSSFQSAENKVTKFWCHQAGQKQVMKSDISYMQKDTEYMYTVCSKIKHSLRCIDRQKLTYFS